MYAGSWEFIPAKEEGQTSSIGPHELLHRRQPNSFFANHALYHSEWEYAALHTICSSTLQKACAYMKRKILAVILAIATVASLLTGCSLGQLSAENIITKSQEADNSNYRMEGDGDFPLNVAADGEDQGNMSINIPISISFEAEAANEQMHGTADMKVSFMGEKAATDMEFYLDGDTRYIC